jgi:hypothetical protein
MATIPFQTKGKAPGVYIQEITLPGPIPGVSTSITAFLGPAMQGPTFVPTSLTNTDQFWSIFGQYIEDPYRVYVTHAVNGFFVEGGEQCYFVRVGTGEQAWLNLKDGKSRNVLLVTALEEGVWANTNVKVSVDNTASLKTTTTAGRNVSVTIDASTITLNTAAANQPNLTTNSANDSNRFNAGDIVLLTDSAKTKSEKATIASISSNASAAPGSTTFIMTANLQNAYVGGTMAPANPVRKVTTSDAADTSKFNPGDVVQFFDSAKTKTERATISSISSDTRESPGVSTFMLVSTLGNDYSGGTMRVADIIPGQNRIRVVDTKGIESGSYVNLSQGGTTEDAVVRTVDATNSFLTFDHALTKTYPMDSATDVTAKTKEFSLKIQATGKADENFANLSLDPRHSHYFENIVSSASVSVDFADPPTTSTPPDNMPAAVTNAFLGGGTDENLNALTTAHYQKGIDSLLKLDDVNLICIPDAVATKAVGGIFQPPDTQAIQTAMVQHCERKQDRFAILDSLPYNPADIPPYASVINQRQNLNSDNGYAALYFPWISIANPLASGRILVPPSGHTAGVYAKSDDSFGVFRAPANEPITSALDLEVKLSDDEQGPLNDQGVNVIRRFTSGGIKIWGARTITDPTQLPWRFVNVRRLLIYIEKSVQEGTRFAVFEPNNLSLWQTLKRLVTSFLRDLWEEGALFGDTADQAFRVRVDETLNPPELRAAGQLVIQVTVVPTTPAEFIVFQVIQDITGASLQESTTT